jgi:hypothetical protein
MEAIQQAAVPKAPAEVSPVVLERQTQMPPTA